MWVAQPAWRKLGVLLTVTAAGAAVRVAAGRSGDCVPAPGCRQRIPGPALSASTLVPTWLSKGKPNSAQQPQLMADGALGQVQLLRRLPDRAVTRKTVKARERLAEGIR